MLSNSGITIQFRINKGFILEGVKFILEKKDFMFNSKACKLTKGTAIGRKVAPTYANLVIGYLETELYKIMALCDCLLIWQGTEEDILTGDNKQDTSRHPIYMRIQ